MNIKTFNKLNQPVFLTLLVAALMMLSAASLALLVVAPVGATHCSELLGTDPTGQDEKAYRECTSSTNAETLVCDAILGTNPTVFEEKEYTACVRAIHTEPSTTQGDPSGSSGTSGSGGTSGLTEPTLNSGTENCAGVDIAIGVGCDPSADNPVTAYANAVINFLAAGVGLVVIIMVAIGGVQFMLAGGNPQATQAAIKRITNAFIGLLFFIFLYAFLQWVIPGGPF